MSENREVSISDESSLKRKESNVELKTDQKFLEFKTALTEEGHVEQKGSVMSYVAKDFMEKLKTQGESSAPLRKSTDVPAINPGLLDELEKDCVRLGRSVDAVMTELTKSLHKITAISVANTQACSAKISEVDSSVEGAVRNMYSLIAQSEELDKTMKPVYELAGKISKMKEILSTLEAHIK